MKEYWRNPEATAQTILPGRWLRTGDIGWIKDGRLTIESRKRDLILRGGENVYPAEIELCLEAHPEVREAAVVGVDHPELGQEVKAIVVPAPGCRPDSEELARFVAGTARLLQGALALGAARGAASAQRDRQGAQERAHRRRGEYLRRRVAAAGGLRRMARRPLVATV